jgi:hypothetical protein
MITNKQCLKCFAFGATYGTVVFGVAALGLFAMSSLTGCTQEPDVEVVYRANEAKGPITWLSRDTVNHDLCVKEAMCDGGLTKSEAAEVCADNDYFVDNPCDAETYEAVSCLNHYGFCGKNGFEIPVDLDGVCDRYFESESLCLDSF